MTGIRVAGAGMHPFGRHGELTATEMGVSAVRAALREAGIDRGGFQAAFCGTAYGGVASGHRVLGALCLVRPGKMGIEFAGGAQGASAR